VPTLPTYIGFLEQFGQSGAGSAEQSFHLVTMRAAITFVMASPVFHKGAGSGGGGGGGSGGRVNPSDTDSTDLQRRWTMDASPNRPHPKPTNPPNSASMDPGGSSMFGAWVPSPESSPVKRSSTVARGSGGGSGGGGGGGGGSGGRSPGGGRSPLSGRKGSMGQNPLATAPPPFVASLDGRAVAGGGADGSGTSMPTGGAKGGATATVEDMGGFLSKLALGF
jgi:hypothetical protein